MIFKIKKKNIILLKLVDFNFNFYSYAKRSTGTN